MTLLVFDLELNENSDLGLMIARTFSSGIVKRYWIDDNPHENEKIIEILESDIE